MPDISMCAQPCEKKETCYRAWATPHEYKQSWFTPPRNPDGSCEFYWHQEQPSIEEEV